MQYAVINKFHILNIPNICLINSAGNFSNIFSQKEEKRYKVEVINVGHCSSFMSGDKIFGNEALHLMLLISAFPVFDFSLHLQ